MGKTLICCTFANEYYHYGLVFVHCHHMYVYTRFIAVCMHKEPSLVWPDPFLEQHVYCLQYKYQAKPLSMVIYNRVAIYMC